MPKTKHRDVVGYWSSRESECGLGVDWAEADERCWRCGYKSVLHRCHIVPDSQGGPDDPSNLVLLCGRCHREAPNVTDPQFMWLWMRATCVGFYDAYWTDRGFEEFARIFRRKAFEGLSYEPGFDELLPLMMREELEKATVHFGEGRMNPATIAWIIWRIEQRLAEPEAKSGA